MSGKVVSVLAAAAGVLLFSVGSSAHHGASLVYDWSRSITVTGTVTEFRFNNPHVLVFFDVAAADGTVVEWSAGMTSTNRLVRIDRWSRDTLRPGDRISVTGSPARSGAPSVWVEQIFMNGQALLTIPGGAG